MRMFITSKNKYLSNDMKIFGTCSIPLRIRYYKQFELMLKCGFYCAVWHRQNTTEYSVANRAFQGKRLLKTQQNIFL